MTWGTTLASDNFGYTGTIPSPPWAASPSGPLAVGASGRVESSSAAVTAVGLYTALSWGADQWAQITVNTLNTLNTNSNSFAGVFLRASPSVATQYGIFISGPNGPTATLTILKAVSGTFTTLAGGTATFNVNAGAVLWAGVQGTLITCTINGQVILQANNTANDVTSGYPGFFLRPNSALADAQASNWSAGNFLGSTSYALGSDEYY
jgi:hypothetical protein